MKIKLKENKDKNKVKSKRVQKLIFGVLDVIQAAEVPLPNTDRAKERMAAALLAVARVKSSLSEAKSIEEVEPLRSREIITYENEHFGQDISLGSYDDVRRKDLKPLTEAGIVLNTGVRDVQATNSPSRKYGLAPLFVELMKAFGTKNWSTVLPQFLQNAINLRKELEHKRELSMFPVRLPQGDELKFHDDAHNHLQGKIIEEFLPRFGFGAEVLYVGDAQKKDLYIDADKLEKLNFFTLKHDELPDIVAYSKEKNLLYLIEAFHSTGPMDELRVRKLKSLLKDCPAQLLFFTAFENKEIFKSKATSIAWETEVWIADTPDHLIHFNGYKFLEINK